MFDSVLINVTNNFIIKKLEFVFENISHQKLFKTKIYKNQILALKYLSYSVGKEVQHIKAGDEYFNNSNDGPEIKNGI